MVQQSAEIFLYYASDDPADSCIYTDYLDYRRIADV